MAQGQGMKILLLDIETAPNLAYVWGLWKQNIGTDWMVEAGYTMCWSAKWMSDRKVHFASVHSDEKGMLGEIHALLDEADAVITYNGDKFDLPILNKEFLLAGLTPPSPYKSIDLYKTAKRMFKFPSNKLDYIAKALGLKGKVVHRGRDLWLGCMNGDEQSWREMERYNRRDVTEIEKVYKRVLPWIFNHPNRALYEVKERPACASCGSQKVQRRGYARTNASTYARYQCQSCGTWSRARVNALSAEQKQSLLVRER